MLTPRICSVETLHDCQLRVKFEDGAIRRFDVSPYATGPWYGELSDVQYFSLVRVLPGGVGIEWPNGQDIAPHELYDQGIAE